MGELLSVAPMMDWTTPQFRTILRFMTKKTYLYSEMLVDDTILHNSENLHRHLGLLDQGPNVIQIGGSNPETLGQASEILQQYGIGNGYYQELNLNCGCPSNKVSSRCFGAKLMLQPSLVREIVSTMSRRVSCPVTVKCRLGVANHRDTYEELREFISEAHAGGANKFIIHARNCVLEGLTTKQNRDIPPLRYEEVQRLRHDFPDLTFILNGGIQSVDAAMEHIKGKYYEENNEDENDISSSTLRPHGAMMGRAVWNNPLVLADVDTRVFGCRSDPCVTRRQIVENYGDYCDSMQAKMTSDILESSRDHYSSATTIQASHRASLIACLCNIFSGIRNNKEFSRRMHHSIKSGGSISEYIKESMSIFPDEVLDEQFGNMGVD